MRFAAGAAYGWLLAGCASLGLGAPREHTVIATTLPPAVAAWIAADVCRQTLRGADPLPQHAGAPVLRSSGSYTIRYARVTGGAFRVDMDGRLMPPELVPLANPRFVPAQQRTAAIGSSGGDLEIALHRRGDATELHVCGTDAPIAQLAEHLRAAVSLLERFAEPAMDGGEAIPCCAHHRAWIGRLMLERSRAEQRAGRWNAARASLVNALVHDDQLEAARLELARLDARLARPDDETSGRLLAFAGGGTVALRGRRELAVCLQHNVAADQRTRRLLRAAELLAAGDIDAAERWGQIARLGGQESTALRAMLARVHRHGGRSETALEFGLEELAERGYAPELLLSMHDDCMRAGDSHQALRLLARHWPQLVATHRADALDRLHRATATVGVEMAARIFLSERNDPQARELLAQWSRDSGVDAAGPAALSRLYELRASVARPATNAWLPRPMRHGGYDLAPGVMPPR
jgi:hypothetical protein